MRTSINIETALHVLFWIFIFTSVNVDWTADWFDKSIRTNTPPPLSVIIFPIIFYVHAFWGIPKYLNKKHWKTYLICFLLIFVLPELVRLTFIVGLNKDADFWQEFYSRDSFLMGEPSVVWMALTCSFAYRFSKDWFVKQQQIEHLAKQLAEHFNKNPREIPLLDLQEAARLEEILKETLQLSKTYLNPELSLAELAKLVGTTDKKLSSLLNQNMKTNFYDYINAFRIALFKKSVEEGALTHLSILGLAMKCGFKSKSSFYRAFKKETGMSPSEFIH